MKKLLLVLFGFLIGAQSFAQNPDIFDTWYLHNLIIDGQDNIPNNLNQNLRCDFYDFDPGWNAYTFYFPNENTLETFEVTYDPVNPELSMVDIVGLTEGICYSQECYDFFGLYSPFYFDYQNTVMTYQIIINTDGTKTLVITNIDGDQAIYNTDVFLGSQDFLRPSYVIFPNPVSNQLFISSENLQTESIAIYNISGQRILSERNNTNAVDVSGLSKGVYFLEMITSEGRYIEKFVKK